MTYKEEKKDLFSVSDDYALAHCISADFALGAGIAVKFRNMGVKKELISTYNDSTRYGTYLNEWNERNTGTCLLTTVERPVYNLVTKARYFHKPTYDTVKHSLCMMRDIYSPEKIAMPKIGCGLDGLEWDKVREIIKDVFKDTSTEILVCYL